MIDEQRRDAIGGLAKLVAKQAHGIRLARALERDAPTIGRALALQERALQIAAMDIRSRLEVESARFYIDRVVRPYKTGNLDDAWPDDRRAWVKIRALGNDSEALDAAQAAARQMQIVWARVLSGEYSATELIATLKDTEDLLAAANALEVAEARK